MTVLCLKANGPYSMMNIKCKNRTERVQSTLPPCSQASPLSQLSFQQTRSPQKEETNTRTQIPGSAFGAGVRIHKVRSTVFYPLGFMLRACKTKTVLLSVDVSFLPTRQTTVLFPTGFLKETNGTYIAQCVRPRGQRWCHYTSACLEPGPASPAEQIGTCEYEERRASDTQRWVSSKEGGEVWQQSQAHFAHWQLAHTVRT